MTELATHRTGARPLRIRRTGAAWLVHAAGAPDPSAVAFASGLAADEHHRLVVADLPADAGPAERDRVASVLAEAFGFVDDGGTAESGSEPDGDGVRLVLGRAPVAGAVAVGRWTRPVRSPGCWRHRATAAGVPARRCRCRRRPRIRGGRSRWS